MLCVGTYRSADSNRFVLTSARMALRSRGLPRVGSPGAPARLSPCRRGGVFALSQELLGPVLCFEPGRVVSPRTAPGPGSVLSKRLCEKRDAPEGSLLVQRNATDF